VRSFAPLPRIFASPAFADRRHVPPAQRRCLRRPQPAEIQQPQQRLAVRVLLGPDHPLNVSLGQNPLGRGRCRLRQPEGAAGVRGDSTQAVRERQQRLGGRQPPNAGSCAITDKGPVPSLQISQLDLGQWLASVRQELTVVMSRAGRIIYRFAGRLGGLLSHRATAYVSALTLMHRLARWLQIVAPADPNVRVTQRDHGTIPRMVHAARRL
jgi:hypothetical protein